MPESYGPSTPPVFSRSRLALEVAAELVGADGWPYLRAHISLRHSDFDETGFGLFGSGTPDGITKVSEGGVGLAMINPSAVLTMAYRGAGPFDAPLPVPRDRRPAVVRPDNAGGDGADRTAVVRRP